MKKDSLIKFSTKELLMTKDEFLRLPASAALFKLAGVEYDKKLYKQADRCSQRAAEELFIKWLAKVMRDLR